VDTKESSVFRPSETSEDHHPHACTDGLVFMTYTVFDEAVGEEVERLEVVPCRRCADSLDPKRGDRERVDAQAAYALTHLRGEH
jgi:hypothetical protein